MTVSLDALLPAPACIEPDDLEAELCRRYAYPDLKDHGCYVRANMVVSLDGGAWGPDHRSGSINDAADGRVFAVLRALADVVVVGAGTARAEGYTQVKVDGPLGRLRTAPLELALVTRTGRVPPALRDAAQAPYVLTCPDGAGRARPAVGEDRVLVANEPIDALDQLAERGLRRVLCEGGPSLLGSLLDADRLDELCLTTTPVLVGPGASRIVGGKEGPAAALREAKLTHLLHRDGTTLARWLVSSRFDQRRSFDRP